MVATGFVMDLYVRPSHRRRGIATELLRAVADLLDCPLPPLLNTTSAAQVG